MADRVNAGAVEITRTQQAIESPLIALPDREAGRAVSLHLHAAQILQNRFGTVNVLEESRLGQVTGPLMPITVAGEFMPLGHQALDDGRIPLGNPSKGEESSLDIMACQHSQDPVHVALHAAFARLPARTRDVGCEGRDLEVVLHVDSQGVDDR